MAGAFTESTVIGTASDTIDRLDIPEAEKTRLKNNIPVAYAVSLPGGHGIRRLVSVGRGAAPASSRPEGREPETGEPGVVGGPILRPGVTWHTRNGASARIGWPMPRRAGQSRISSAPRAPSASSSNASGEVPSSWMPRRRPFCKRAMSSPSRRGGRVLLGGSLPLREEVEDPALLDFPMATLDVVVTKRDVAEQTTLGPGPADTGEASPSRN